MINGNLIEKIDALGLNGLYKSAKGFARCKPDQKARLVQFIRDNDQKVAMVGDGANDCAAIKQADIGISFADTDASYSSPFSSMTSSLDCIPKVLLEGRCATSICNDVVNWYIVVGMLK